MMGELNVLLIEASGEGLPQVRMGESLVLEKKLGYSENLRRGEKQLGCEKTAQ